MKINYTYNIWKKEDKHFYYLNSHTYGVPLTSEWFNTMKMVEPESLEMVNSRRDTPDARTCHAYAEHTDVIATAIRANEHLLSLAEAINKRANTNDPVYIEGSGRQKLVFGVNRWVANNGLRSPHVILKTGGSILHADALALAKTSITCLYKAIKDNNAFIESIKKESAEGAERPANRYVYSYNVPRMNYIHLFDQHKEMIEKLTKSAVPSNEIVSSSEYDPYSYDNIDRECPNNIFLSYTPERNMYSSYCEKCMSWVETYTMSTHTNDFACISRQRHVDAVKKGMVLLEGNNYELRKLLIQSRDFGDLCKPVMETFSIYVSPVMENLLNLYDNTFTNNEVDLETFLRGAIEGKTREDN